MKKTGTGQRLLSLLLTLAMVLSLLSTGAWAAEIEPDDTLEEETVQVYEVDECDTQAPDPAETGAAEPPVEEDISPEEAIAPQESIDEAAAMDAVTQEFLETVSEEAMMAPASYNLTIQLTYTGTQGSYPSSVSLTGVQDTVTGAELKTQIATAAGIPANWLLKGTEAPNDTQTLSAYITALNTSFSNELRYTAAEPVALVIDGTAQTYVYDSLSTAFPPSYEDPVSSNRVYPWKAGSTLQLLQDVTLDGTGAWEITDGTAANPLSLDLNGHSITCAGDADTRITVKGGALKLLDSTQDQKGKILNSGTVRNGIALTGASNGSFALTGGTIQGFAGAGIAVNGGSQDPQTHAYTYTGLTVSMSGGAITGNTGPGVDCTQGGSFTMTGGSITGNKEGGVQGPLTVSGKPVITDNTAQNALQSQSAVPCNVLLREETPAGQLQERISVNGALTSGAKMGVSLIRENQSGAPTLLSGTFTKDFTTAGNTGEPSAFFTSDSTEYVVSRTDAGEGQLRDAVRYPLWVGGQQVTEAITSGQGWSYDHSAHTLTLDGFTYNGAENGIEAGEQYLVPLTIQVKGTNAIHSTGNNALRISAPLITTGDGTLTAQADDNSALLLKKSWTFKSGTLNASNQSAGSPAISVAEMSMDNGTVNISGSTENQGILSAERGVSINGGSLSATNTHQDGYGISCGAAYSLNVGTKIATVTFSGGKNACNCPVVNAGPGTGWTDAAGVTDEAVIPVSADGQSLASYRKARFVKPHEHDFTYTAKDATITALCNGNGKCDITEGLTLTINPPQGTLVYDGTAKAASLSTGYDTTAFPGTLTITYQKDGKDVQSCTDAGTYTASVTVGKATATTKFTIAKATVGLKWGTTSLTYNGKLQVPVANATGLLGKDTCTVTVYGAQTNAGSYTARAAKLSNANYKLPDLKTQDYTIAKADREAPEAPVITRIAGHYISIRTVPGVEYSINGKTWVTKSTIYNLTTNKVYTLRARYAADANYNVSPTVSVRIKTLNAANLLNLGFKTTQSKGKLKVQFGSVPKATGYKVYAQYCGQKFPSEPIATVKGTSVTITRLNGAKLNQKTCVKIKVVAMKDNTVLGTSKDIHVAGMYQPRATNPASIKVPQSILTMNVKQAYFIKPTVTKANKKLALLPSWHTAALRYISSDTQVATVNSSGKIVTKGRGSCKVYVMAQNGLAAEILVSVR